MAQVPGKRYGSVCGLTPENYEMYKKYHESVWPGVLESLRKCNWRNFTIYYDKIHNLLFSHMEYVGTDFDKDASLMAADPEVQRWWKIMMPIMEPCDWEGPLPCDGGDGNGKPFWTPLEELFHDGLSATGYNDK